MSTIWASACRLSVPALGPCSFELSPRNEAVNRDLGAELRKELGAARAALVEKAGSSTCGIKFGPHG
jgi:hypothetical protein